MRRSTGLTFVEMLAAIGAVGLLVATVLPTLGERRAASYRNCCASNLNLAMQGMIRYAGDYDGKLPTCGYGPSSARYDVIGAHYRKRRSAAHSNSRNLFLAVRHRYVTPAMLICPETSDVPASTGPLRAPWHDFNVSHGDSYVNRLSYSYHLQFSHRQARRGRPFKQGYPITLASDARMAVLADRNPCLRNLGAKYADGSYSTWFGMPPGRSGRYANSANHDHAGQNVGFVDGQVRWADAPTVGVDGDNIYTVHVGADRLDGHISPHTLPTGPDDSFLVP